MSIFYKWNIHDHALCRIKLHMITLCPLFEFIEFMLHIVSNTLSVGNVPRDRLWKILGLHLSSDLKWDLQVNEILKRANGRLYMLKVLRKFGLSLADLITVYVGYIRPLAEYAAPVWHPGLTEKQSVSLERIQKRACTIMLGGRYTDYENALLMCNIPSLKDRRIELCLTFANSLLCSDEFRNWLPPTRGVLHNRALRNAHKLTTPRWTTKRYLQSPIPYYVQLLNGKM
jgi:hypothetical protein